MTKPNKKSLAKLRADVIKAAMRLHGGRNSEFFTLLSKLENSCAALAKRTRK